MSSKLFFPGLLATNSVYSLLSTLSTLTIFRKALRFLQWTLHIAHYTCLICSSLLWHFLKELSIYNILSTLSTLLYNGTFWKNSLYNILSTLSTLLYNCTPLPKISSVILERNKLVPFNGRIMEVVCTSLVPTTTVSK